jgi:NarL family two-component system response regulator YdfI
MQSKDGLQNRGRMIRVFIVAASAVTRSGLEGLFRRDARFKLVGGGSTLAASEFASRGDRPDVVVVDGPEPRNSLSQFRIGEGPAIVLLADDLSRSELQAALHNGAQAIVGRNSSAPEIAAAIEAAAAGLVVLGEEQMEAFLPPLLGRFDGPDISVEPLTPREIEVLALLAEGAGNKRIADRLKVSEHTVKFHVSSILGKLGAASRTEAVTEGIRRGYVLV